MIPCIIYVFLATDVKVISILEETKGQVRFNTKLLQNILTKVDVPVPVGGNEEIRSLNRISHEKQG